MEKKKKAYVYRYPVLFIKLSHICKRILPYLARTVAHTAYALYERALAIRSQLTHHVVAAHHFVVSCCCLSRFIFPSFSVEHNIYKKNRRNIVVNSHAVIEFTSFFLVQTEFLLSILFTRSSEKIRGVRAHL